MSKFRCPKFGCNGIGLPAGTRRAFGKGRATIGDTPAYLSGGSSSNRLFTAFGYRGHKVRKERVDDNGNEIWYQMMLGFMR